MSAGRTPTMPVIAAPQDALRLAGVSKVTESADRVTALRGVSLAFPAGSFTAVMGPSGSGKSTLLQCAAGLDAPTSGQVFVGGEEVPQGDEAGLTEFRRERVGFVFQQYNLIPYLTVAQNVALPLRFAGKRVDQRARAALLDRLGLAELAGQLPAELSGGQQQRVAIARALSGPPGDPVRRRADRGAGPCQQPRRARPAARGGRRIRPDGGDGDPRPGRRRPRRRGAIPGGRPHRGPSAAPVGGGGGEWMTRMETAAGGVR